MKTTILTTLLILASAAPLPAQSHHHTYPDKKGDDRISSSRSNLGSIDQPPPPPTYFTYRKADRIVRQTFQELLSRNPDCRETETYTNYLLNEGWEEARLFDALRRLREFRNRDVCALVTRAYQTELGRNPDPSGMATYTSRLREEGWSERHLREHLRNSPEARERNARIIIKNAYRELLQREPDESGVNTFMNRIVRQGWGEKQVRNTIRNSPEYRQLHTPTK